MTNSLTETRRTLPAVVVANTVVACGFPLIAYVPTEYGVSPLTAALQLSVPMLIGATASLFVDTITTLRQCHTVLIAQMAVLVLTSTLVAVRPDAIEMFWLSRVGAALAAGSTVTVMQMIHLDNHTKQHAADSRFLAATPGISAALGWVIGGIVPALTSLPVFFAAVAVVSAAGSVPLVTRPYRLRRPPPRSSALDEATCTPAYAHRPTLLALLLAGVLLTVPLLLTVSGLRGNSVVVLGSSALVIVVCAGMLVRAGWVRSDRGPAIGAMAVTFAFGFGFTSAGVFVSFTSLAAAPLLTIIAICLSQAATGAFVTLGSHRKPRRKERSSAGRGHASQQLAWVAASFALYAISSLSAMIVLMANAFRGFWLGRTSVTSITIQQELKRRNPHVEVFGISNVVRAGGMAYGSLVVGSVAPSGSGAAALTCGLTLVGLSAATVLLPTRSS
ncbi:MFS transporter [Gordonia sp. (in: high G+C Gram-positive bacteria)]|uniref:MFS transporter n=1 Tax=Gordonia sp. (in: high G+C Gram-positive bacteria) TaxID=84139 RepID=UPI003F9B38D9